MSTQFKRLFFIFLVVEIAAFYIAIGFSRGSFLLTLIGLNEAFLAAGMIVLDHESRGRGQ